jgi:hypothetical protein
MGGSGMPHSPRLKWIACVSKPMYIKTELRFFHLEHWFSLPWRQGRGFGLERLYNSSMTSETALDVTSGTARFEADAVPGRLMLPGTL